MKYVFIGAGNMGGAAARAFAKYVVSDPADITVVSRTEATLEKFRNLGVTGTLSGTEEYFESVSSADIIFVVVKPWVVKSVADDIRKVADYSRQIVVCMAPGIKESDFREWLDKGDGTEPPIAYIIPNTAIEVSQSMTFIAPVSISRKQTELLADLFKKVGAVQIVGMDMMIAGTSLASCGIAYAMRYISASASGGVALGFDRKTSESIVCNTVMGAAGLIGKHRSNPEDEIDKVTTPGGMTLKGLGAMEASGFSQSVMNGLTAIPKGAHRIVVKVGSNVLTREDGTLDNTRMSSLVDQIVGLKHKGFEVILITSGAVACGRSLVSENRKLDKVQQRQLYSAVGQVRLMDKYSTLFDEYGIKVGQILTQKKNFSTKREYNNQKGCIEVMLQGGILPIVNENDTVCIDELMFTDNDELSALVARMMDAKALVILSQVDGLYDDEGKVIRQVKSGDLDKTAFIRPEKSKGGRGGMTSKFNTAMSAASEGIPTYIANGKKDNILPDLFFNPETVEFTEFIK